MRDVPVMIVGDYGEAARWTRSRDYVPSAEPGCLAPHHWLDDGRSLYDLFGAGFTLLVLGGGRTRARHRPRRGTVTPLTIVRLDGRSMSGAARG